MPDASVWGAEIQRRRQAGKGLEFEPDALAAAVGSAWPDPALERFLDKLVAGKEIRRLEVRLCPNPDCRHPLDAGMIENGECPICRFDFKEKGEEPISSIRYQIMGEPSRDIRWMIVVHGMNTRAPWQEDLSWLIANKLKYAAPVLIHKYGWATIDVLVTSRHRQLAKSLGNKIRRASDYARTRGLTAAPDILVHSFGSRIFTLVLQDNEFADLKFGRVITAGSIIRPDFPWSSFIDLGRIEAVLNHMGGRDIPVLIAQFLIPGTGPSGRVGFIDIAVLNQRTSSFGHSDCLSEPHLRETLAKGGLWDRFLTQPKGQFAPTDSYRKEKWRPAFAPLRWAARGLGIALFVVLFPFSVLRRLVDP
ncbi:hypothetical protein [Rhizobium leguminosarum]|nr:hypothetical protein HB775_28675 [Rhizobium leguminosarum bv. trifolii]